MRPPIRFGPGIVCPPGYLCIAGQEPIKLPEDPGEPDQVQYPPGYDPIWDTADIPAGASFEVRRGLLPTATPTFEIHNPYYGDDYIAERGYSGSYGWRLPGGSGVSGGIGGAFDPYDPWGGEDRRYDISNPYSDLPAFGTNLTPYDERWFISGGLLPESYESYIEDIEDGVGTIPAEAGLLHPTISDSYQIEPPRELTLWGSPFTATSDVGVFGLPEFIHPYYEWLATADSIDLDALLSEEA